MTDEIKKDCKKLNSLVIRMEPKHYRSGYTEMSIKVIADGKSVFMINEFVEDSDFKSIGEYAFESLVRKFRAEMGWKS